MAEKNNKSVIGGVMGADEGFNYVRSKEDYSLSEYLSLYLGRIVAYRVEDVEWGTRITMRIDFPPDTKQGNARMWAFFIAQAAHKLSKKTFTEVSQGIDSIIVYISWTLYAHPKYMESKGTSRNDF